MKLEYKPSMYRVYKRLLFWKRGVWRHVDEVHKVLIRPVQGGYEVYLVRKHGFDLVYRHAALEKVRKQAQQVAQRCGWTVEERAEL